MAEVIRMPKMSDTMTEGVIASWLKKVGDKVKSGDILAEVETDKATMELENFEDGVLLYIGVENGQSVPVDAIIAVVGQQGEDIAALIGGSAPVATAQTRATPAPEVVEAAPVATPVPIAAMASTSSHDDRLKASPLAKKMAEEKGIDLNAIQGSGDGGRIVKRDVESAPMAVTVTAVTTSVSGVSFEEVPVSQMRKTIAKRLAESKFTAPHFYLNLDIDMEQATAARSRMNEMANVKISFNDLVIKACAVALKQHPKINSSWLGDKIRINHQVNVGVAMAVDEGLLVPVVRNADSKGLSTIAAEVKAYSAKAKDKKLQPTDWEGNTFTISNLGMFGIEAFTAIINPPDACILAVGAIRQEPVVKDGQIVVGQRMKVTLSCDHRVVDGATGAAFLQTVKSLLEDPMRMLI